jgi:ribosome-associated heat shock protein Hsp15
MVRIGGQAVKPSREVLPMDAISVRKNQMNLSLKVLDIPASRVGAKWVGIYCEDTTPEEEQEHFKMMQASREYYRKKGTGRPTKKDRRDLDEYMDDDE